MSYLYTLLGLHLLIQFFELFSNMCSCTPCVLFPPCSREVFTYHETRRFDGRCWSCCVFKRTIESFSQLFFSAFFPQWEPWPAAPEHWYPINKQSMLHSVHVSNVSVLIKYYFRWYS